MSGGNGWGNPAPAGLVALGMACFTFFALLGGRVDGSGTILLACWLIGGFVVQLVTGLIELAEGNTAGGCVFTFFSAFFMLTGGLEFIVKFLAKLNGIAIDTRMDGWAWLSLAIALLLFTPAYFKTPLPLCLAICIMDIAVPCIAFMDLGVLPKETGDPIASICMLVAGILALYLAGAIASNSAFGRTVLPIPGPPIKD